MTRLPADAYEIEPLRGKEWPTYRVGPLCALTTCSRFVNPHTHHIVRRSFTIGPYDWVKINGHVVGNLMPLCYEHHQQITENKTRIVWDEHSHRFYWEEPDGGNIPMRQPPSLQPVYEVQVEQAEACPTCGHRLSRKFENDNGDEARRPRKTWTITVPNDAREVGADVLDTLLESARLLLDDHGLSYGHNRSVRYFVLSTSLGLFVAHAEDLLSEGEGSTE